MSKSPVSIVCDAGPIIHLDELGYLPLLDDFSKILIPDQVWQEVETHRPQVLINPGLSLQRGPVAISSQPAVNPESSRRNLARIARTVYPVYPAKFASRDY